MHFTPNRAGSAANIWKEGSKVKLFGLQQNNNVARYGVGSMMLWDSFL